LRNFFINDFFLPQYGKKILFYQLHSIPNLKITSIVLLYLLQQVRIRESNFHSSLIQGAQNFDSSDITSANNKNTDSSRIKVLCTLD
jgi:hypothetical protein